MGFKLPDIFKKKFGVKIFAIVVFFIFITSLSFIVFFYRHQSRSLSNSLIHNNLLLAGILAYNSRIGVFSENKGLLDNPVGGMFKQEETVEVSVYNLKGLLLVRRERFGAEGLKRPGRADAFGGHIERKIFDRLNVSEPPFFVEGKDFIEFWSPVIASSERRTVESLFVEEKLLPEKERIIGFVRITVGKSALNKRLSSLLVKSTLIGFVFLMVGSIITYLTIKRMTNPLNALTKGVKVLGEGNLGEKVPVETEDEIGELAIAFNQMSESLLKRDEEKEKLEEQLRHSQKMEAIGTLAGGIAHDFNNILGVIVGYAQLTLLTNSGNADIERFLKEILQAGKRAQGLVEQILAFGRRGTQKRSPLYIEPIAQEVLKMISTSLPDDIELRQDFKPGLSPVLSDPTQMHQALMNLCTNAGQAMEDGGGVLKVSLGEVEIDSGDPALTDDMKPGWYQVLRVSDTGHGIDSSFRERIFDPFFTTKETGKGTGMGLSVVHGIVKSHGGKIICSSEPGKGTTFEVYFPAISPSYLLEVQIN
jgi:signal transduction histidine kinase